MASAYSWSLVLLESATVELQIDTVAELWQIGFSFLVGKTRGDRGQTR